MFFKDQLQAHLDDSSTWKDHLSSGHLTVWTVMLLIQGFVLIEYFWGVMLLFIRILYIHICVYIHICTHTHTYIYPSHTYHKVSTLMIQCRTDLLGTYYSSLHCTGRESQPRSADWCESMRSAHRRELPQHLEVSDSLGNCCLLAECLPVFCTCTALCYVTKLFLGRYNTDFYSPQIREPTTDQRTDPAKVQLGEPVSFIGVFFIGVWLRDYLQKQRWLKELHHQSQPQHGAEKLNHL